MKYILVIKGHSTKFTWLRPIQAKEARFVRVKLKILYYEVGSPLIYHNDNGSEFVAIVVQQLLARNRFVCTVTGQPYKPIDKGSVERQNREIKKVIDSCLLVEKKKGKANPSWVEMLPMTTGVLKNRVGYGSNKTTPYHHVYGIDYDCPIGSLRLRYV